VEEKNNYIDPERDATNLMYSAGPVLLPISNGGTVAQKDTLCPCFLVL